MDKKLSYEEALEQKRQSLLHTQLTKIEIEIAELERQINHYDFLMMSSPRSHNPDKDFISVTKDDYDHLVQNYTSKEEQLADALVKLAQCTVLIGVILALITVVVFGSKSHAFDFLIKTALTFCCLCIGCYIAHLPLSYRHQLGYKKQFKEIDVSFDETCYFVHSSYLMQHESKLSSRKRELQQKRLDLLNKAQIS